MHKYILTVILFLIVTFSYGDDKLIISSWLTTKPLDIVYPAFHKTGNVEGEKFSNRDLLTFEHAQLAGIKPVEGQPFEWIRQQQTTWDLEYVDEKGFISFETVSETNKPVICFTAVYITADRWLKATLEVNTPQMAQVYLNGKALGNKTSVETEEGTYGKVDQDLELEKGKHLLMIKSLYTPGDTLDWKLSASITPGSDFNLFNISTDRTPLRTKTINDILEGVKITGIIPSPFGELYAVSYRQAKPPKGDTERWTEIKEKDNGSTVHSFRHADISNLQWLPASNAVTYITRNGNKSTLHLLNLENGKTSLLLEDIQNLGNYSWSNDEEFIIYSIREENTDDSGHIRHILGMQDRQPQWRSRSFLYYLDVDSKTTFRLTYGNLTTSLHDISPGGDKIMFSQSRHDYQERPFYKHNVYLMDLKTLEVDTLWADKKWYVYGSFSPDGEQLLFTGGPDAFEGAGKNIPDDMIANNYDTQAYIYNINGKEITPITYDFDPSITNTHWHPGDDHIYLTAQYEDKAKLYRYNVRRGRFSEIPTPADVVSSIRFASKAGTAAYIGQGMSDPAKGYWLNTDNDKSMIIEDTENDNYQHVVFGENKDWNYQTVDGENINGRVYLPPGFDKDETYPLIVYYYGGTTPVSRSFGGRYPFNLWAGQGYVVYVMQPSGAIGFGQEFSAAHVNNWGITVAGEIIESTKAFIEDHRFVDSDKVGCIGASYGGFMTMLLTTQTDIFSAAISHAGISSISSYWGEGYWGYSYSALATAGKYPWNSPEIYFDQSPLFKADKVNTPLLLVTGDEDTNVPPGESIQMYTALKILGSPVELLKVKGQDHHILDYEKRIEWNNAIIAWFDKWLKDQVEWWDEQFPEKNY